MLQRAIGKTGLVLLIINSIIGAGIFGLPSKVFALTGVYSLAAFGVCALIVLLFILCFAEVSSRFDATGGPYLYVHTAFGPAAGFATGWLLLLSRIFNYATLVNLGVTYAAYFFKGAEAPLYRILIISAVTAAIGYSNFTGVRNTTRISNFFTIAKLAPLTLFIVAGFFFFNGAAFTAPPLPSVTSFSSAGLLLVFAFGGFESVLVASGEIKAPRQQLPSALLVATAVVAFFYILIQLVCIAVLPTLATSGKPLADAATLMLGSSGAALISAGAVISITGTLNVLLLSGSRLLYAFAAEGQLPVALSKVHLKYKSPYLAVAIVVVVTILVSITWTFITALAIGAIIRVLLYAVVCATLLRLRQTQKEEAHFYKLRWGRLLAWAGLALAIWLLAASTKKEAFDVSVCLLIGFVVYKIFNGRSSLQAPRNNSA